MNTTKGPWFAEPGIRGTIYIRGAFKMNGLAYRVATVDAWKNGPADAQLIAAAPRMFESLCFALNAQPPCDGNHETDDTRLACVRCNLEETIAAAEAPYTADVKAHRDTE